MPSTTTVLNTAGESAHGNPSLGGRRLTRQTETATALANAATHTGAWVSTTSFRRASAVARSNGTLNVSLFLDLDYDGDNTVDETITVTAAAVPVITDRAFSAAQARIRITNAGGSAQNVSGHLMLSD